MALAEYGTISGFRRRHPGYWLRERAAESGKGYQTLINEALRVSLSPESAPLTAELLRKILHEELRVA